SGGGLNIAGTAVLRNVGVTGHTGSWGSGIVVEPGGALIGHDCRITDNVANFRAGAIYAGIRGPGSGLAFGIELHGCDVSRNTANVSRGGAIELRGAGSFAMNGGTLTGNTSLRDDAGAIRSSGSDVSLVGVDVTGNYAKLAGGALKTEGGSLLLEDSNLHENTARLAGGGGLWASGTIVTIIRTPVTANHASQSSGGGLYLDNNAVAEITDSVIDFNEARAGSDSRSGFGAGLFVAGGSAVTLVGTPVADNIADKNGGGFYLIEDASLTYEEGFIARNQSLAPAGGGGGIFANASTVNVSTSTLEANTAADFGAAVFASSSVVEFEAAAVVGNVAADNGAAFSLDRGSVLMFRDGEIVDNHAQDATVTFAVESDVHFENALIAGNTATESNSGVFVARGHLTVTDSALLGNTAGIASSGAVSVVDSSAGISGSCIVDNSFPAVTSSAVLGTILGATGNWWGDPSGPSGEGPGSGDGITGGWFFTPWATDILGPCVFAEAPWAPGQPPSGACEVLVWFDEATVIADTDEGLDDWRITAAARFYDFDPTRDREIASIGITSFDGDAGDTVVLEQQWRTEMWDSYANLIRLDDVAITIRENDGRAGSDIATFRWSPGTLIECGETMSFTALIGVTPSSGRFLRN
ncbi:MAG: hypothetical protein HKN01_06580, partial [Acidimicrobiia bacterium]|nr:hypothetical protein [Acidimicrobiia bacterium]